MSAGAKLAHGRGPPAPPRQRPTGLLNAVVARVGYSSDVTPNPYWDALLLEYDVPISF